MLFESAGHTDSKIYFSIVGVYLIVMDNVQELVRALQCPKCEQVMLPPIILCSKGHSICHTCKSELKKCPTCGRGFLKVTNTYLEDISRNIKHPCKYQRAGCTREFPLGLKDNHEKECRYGPHKCPYFIVDYIKCDWEGSSTFLDYHIKSCHNDNVSVNLTKGKQSNRFENYTKQKCGGYWHQSVFAFDKIFFFYSKIIGSYLCTCYMYVGAREDNNNYKYTINMKSLDGNQSVTSTLACPHYQDTLDGKFPNGKCAEFHTEFLKICVNKKVNLPFEYNIFQD